MERSIVAFSRENDAQTASDEIIGQILEASMGRTPLLIVFSAEYSVFSVCSVALHTKFPRTTVIGSSTYVVFSSKGHSDCGITALAIFEGVQCSSGVLLEVKRHPALYEHSIVDAISRFDSVDNLVCMEFTTSYCKCEELVLDTIKSVHKRLKIYVPVVGSTAGAIEEIQSTLVSLNGEVFKEACVFVYIKNLFGKIYLYKENFFNPTEHTFKITDIDCDERCIYEIDNKPVFAAISEATGIAPRHIPEYLQLHPIGRIDGDEIFVTAIDSVHEDGHITMLTRIYNETKITLLELGNIEEAWNRTLEKTRKNIPNPSFGIAINCTAMSEYLQKIGHFDALVDSLKSANPTFMGTSGFGEQYMCENINMTLVLVGFE